MTDSTPATAAPPLPCPVHAACAHPCRFVRALNGYPRSMVDAAIERDRRLQWATTYGGMVAT